MNYGLISVTEHRMQIVRSAFVFAIVILIFASSFAGAQTTTCTKPADGMVAWWTGDNGTADSLGSSNGIMPSSVAFVGGEVGLAFSCGATPTYVSVSNSSALEPTALSLEAWVKAATPGPGPFKYIFSKGAGPQGASYALYTRTGGGLAFYVSDGTNFYVSPDSTAVWDGNWHNVAGTFDGSAVHLFVDGQEAGTATPVPVGFHIAYGLPTSNDAFIGHFYGNTTFDFVGQVDEVQLFSRALSQAEIQAIYAAGSAGVCKPSLVANCVTAPNGMVAWWTGDNTTADVLSASNGSYASPVGFAAGQVGAAFSLGAVPRYVQIPDNSPLEPTALSLEAWVKAATPGSFKYIFSKGAGPQGASYALYTGAGGGLAFYVSDGVNSPVLSPVAAPAAVWDGNWHNVAGIFDGSAVHLFVDGQEVGAGMAVPAGFHIAYGLPDSNDAFIGHFFSDATLDFVGQVDEVQLFNRALSQAEIQAIYAAGTAGTCKGTPPAITSASSTTFMVGKASVFTVTTTGKPTPTLSMTGALPIGVSFTDNGNGTATLAGTPAAGSGGTYSMTFKASNGIVPDATQSFTLTVSDAAPPIVTVSTNPNTLWPPNGKMVPVTVAGAITSSGSGVNASSAAYVVTDEYGQIHPSGKVVLASGGHYSFTILLQASRLGSDMDGRRYTVTVSARDNAGNLGSASAPVTVPHDQGTTGK